jgi:hypothetical protein
MHHLRKFGQRTLSITVSSMPPWMPVLPIRVPEHMAHGMCRLGRSFRVLHNGVTIAGNAVVPDLAVCQISELLSRHTPWLRSCSASGALHSSHTRASGMNTHGSQQQMAPHRQCVMEPVHVQDIAIIFWQGPQHWGDCRHLCWPSLGIAPGRGGCHCAAASAAQAWLWCTVCQACAPFWHRTRHRIAQGTADCSPQTPRARHIQSSQGSPCNRRATPHT